MSQLKSIFETSGIPKQLKHGLMMRHKAGLTVVEDQDARAITYNQWEMTSYNKKILEYIFLCISLSYVAILYPLWLALELIQPKIKIWYMHICTFLYTFQQFSMQISTRFWKWNGNISLSFAFPGTHYVLNKKITFIDVSLGFLQNILGWLFFLDWRKKKTAVDICKTTVVMFGEHTKTKVNWSLAAWCFKSQWKLNIMFFLFFTCQCGGGLSLFLSPCNTAHVQCSVHILGKVLTIGHQGRHLHKRTLCTALSSIHWHQVNYSGFNTPY